MTFIKNCTTFALRISLVRKLRIIFGFLVLLVFLYRMFYQVIVVVYYKVNEEYIAKTLCVNRMNANSSCHGKCHLKKLLKKTESPEDQPNNNPLIPPNSTSNKDFKVFIPDYISLSSPVADIDFKDIPYINLYHYLFISELLIPPKRNSHI